MALPKAVGSRVLERLRNSRRLRQAGLRCGLIAPRAMHTAAESELLSGLAQGRRRAVEIGVYEGSSALVFVGALPRGADLHLVDPFGDTMPGADQVDQRAVRALVGRAARRRGGPRVHWHVELSEQAVEGWSSPVDLVFIDGDRSREGCRRDWDAWSPTVRTGGVVAFHDARGGEPGPTAVVNELFGAGDPPGWRVLAERDTLVAVERVPVTGSFGPVDPGQPA